MDSCNSLYTLDGSLLQGSMSSCIHTYRQLKVTSLPTGIFLGSGRKPDNPEESHVNTGEAYETLHRPGACGDVKFSLLHSTCITEEECFLFFYLTSVDDIF